MAGIIEFFDRIYLDRKFASGENGARVFFPFGRSCDGYILPLEREADIRRALRLQAIASCVAGLLFAFFGMSMATARANRWPWLDWIALFSWFALLAGIIIYARFSLVRGLERA